MPLISFGTGPAVENETRWEIKEAIQAGHRCASTPFDLWPFLLLVCGRIVHSQVCLMLSY